MKPGRRIRGVFERMAVRIALWVVPRLSRRSVVRLARISGRIAFRFARSLRRVGAANLELALGETYSAEQRAAILKQAFQTSALMMLDVFWFTRDTERRMAAWVRFDEAMLRMLDGAAQILITGHHGNWETLGQAVSQRGYPLASVAVPLANPGVDRVLVQARRMTGQEIIPRAGAGVRLLRRLRRGGKIALLLDQNTLPHHGGVFVDFFGQPVPVSRAPAVLALRTGAPIGYGWALPDPEGRYRVVTADVIDPRAFGHGGSPEAEAALTQAITRRIEDAVRQWPEHWVWMYKRWKYVPPDADAGRYPFYAKSWRPREKREQPHAER